MTTVTSALSSNESGLKAFIKRRPLISMYILLFLLGWPVQILDALASHALAPKPPDILNIATGLTPAIAAIAVTAILAGRASVKDLFRRFLIWRVGVQWYLTGLFLLAAVILGGIGLHVLFGGAMPEMPIAGAPVSLILFAFTVTVLVGALVNTEEIAWRGFALPRLQSRYGALTAALLIAIPESLFHLPHFWNLNSVFYQNVGLFWFTAFTVAIVFIYTYIFNKTNGSLLIVTLLHASQNAWANLLSDNTLRPFQFTVALMWMIAIALIFLTKGKLGSENP
ncbi:MAG TPA: CPBP family intramembrane glutamic endopeptidase [Anaerolineales bacterium]|nr:CPBP family intramembrane glutamic endopeptidase [Anaerolineales bacterium]